MFILNFEWECCTFKTQGKIAFLAYKYTIGAPQPLTRIALLNRIYSMKKGVLVTFMLKGFQNRTTSDIKTVFTVETCISEAMAKTTTSVTIYGVANYKSEWVEGK